MKFTKPIIFLFLLIFTSATLAWNSVGHRIIAQIAYDQLTPQAKHEVDTLTAVMFHSPYPDARFSRASTWPDRIKDKTTQYNTWHFIDLPIVKDNIHSPIDNTQNVVWAITHAEKIVADKNEPDTRRAKYLSFLIHLIGDIAQPLHCATLYSKQFPTGDKGGNLYLIHSAIAANLHQLWDRGVGLFVSSPNAYQFHYYQIDAIAKQWIQQYPTSFFGNRLTETSASQWADESHHIAVSFVYTLPVNSAPSSEYIQQGQQIVKQQIVLAGDRLANELNQLF